MPAGELAPCVFCGDPILPGEETAGRAPMAAHARCADAALADHDHWESIAAAGEEGIATDEPGTGSAPGGAARSQAGCLGVIGLVVLTAVVLAAYLLALA